MIGFIDDTKAYVGNSASNNVSIIDVATDTVTGYINDVVAPFNQPINIQITPDLQTAYITNPSIGQINIVNIATDTVTGVVAGVSPTSGVLGFAIKADGLQAYASNTNNNTVSIIDLITNAVLGLVNPGAFPFIVPYDIALQETPPAPPPTPPVTTNPGAPAAIIARQFISRFATQSERINIITWWAPLGGSPPVAYYIFRDPTLTVLAGIVYAGNELIFRDPVCKGSNYYYIVSVDAEGRLSVPASVMVTSI
ncbi:MAG TPA: hypothetical protein VGP47_04140 [Parachlamydiaceae bacterium]|nr:hypothetical protein [Parachlamydiaceae bacterium]